MPRLAVVFDTNIYRQLSPEDAAAIALQQDERDVIACTNSWSVMELAAHLCDPADGDRRICHRALKSIWEHCTQRLDDRRLLRVAGDADSQLVLALFNQHLPGRDRETNVMSHVVQQLADSEIGIVPSDVQAALEYLRDHRDTVEAQFTEDMRKVVLGLDSSAVDWQPWPNDRDRRRAELSESRRGKNLPAIATAMVARAAANLDIQDLPANELRGRVQFVLDNFTTPLHFYEGLLRRTIESGIDYSRAEHANSIWDVQLCFFALPQATIEGTPVTLVSNERAIRSAAVAAGCPDRVLKMSEFRARLATDTL
jgi:hypothetical protein